MHTSRATYRLEKLRARHDNGYFLYHAHGSTSVCSVVATYIFWAIYRLHRLHADEDVQGIQTETTYTARGSYLHYSTDQMAAH